MDKRVPTMRMQQLRPTLAQISSQVQLGFALVLQTIAVSVRLKLTIISYVLVNYVAVKTKVVRVRLKHIITSYDHENKVLI